MSATQLNTFIHLIIEKENKLRINKFENRLPPYKWNQVKKTQKRKERNTKANPTYPAHTKHLKIQISNHYKIKQNIKKIIKNIIIIIIKITLVLNITNK